MTVIQVWITEDYLLNYEFARFREDNPCDFSFTDQDEVYEKYFHWTVPSTYPYIQATRDCDLVRDLIERDIRRELEKEVIK